MSNPRFPPKVTASQYPQWMKDRDHMDELRRCADEMPLLSSWETVGERAELIPADLAPRITQMVIDDLRAAGWTVIAPGERPENGATDAITWLSEHGYSISIDPTMPDGWIRFGVAR